jgi:acetolactate synthase-1/3 small subunit
MKHVIAVLVENEPGALSRIVGLFAQRNYNIMSLNVAPTEDVTLSRITITTSGTDRVIEQITKHLNRLIDVVKVMDLTDAAYIERELLLIKVKVVGTQRDEVKRVADIFRGQVIDVTPSIFTIQLVGTGSKLDAFLEAIDPLLVMEVVRSGVSGIARGERHLSI